MTHVPSVTSLLNILNKPALLYWANKQGLNGINIKYAQQDNKSEGQKKHTEIEDFLINGLCVSDELKQQKIESLFKDVNVISVEESFVNEFFKGRVDIRFKKDGLSYIGDFKKKFKKPYLEHYLQLVAYKYHFGCDKICIIDLENYNLHELSLENELKYQDLIFNLINIYNITQSLA